MKRTLAMLVSSSALALVAGCAQMGVGGQSGCRTVFVFVPGEGGDGAVTPVTQCDELPREQLDDGAIVDLAAATLLSPAARATRPPGGGGGYSDPNEMLENGDMAAFMEQVRESYDNDSNRGAWGYLVVDALADDDLVLAQDTLDLMEERSRAPSMSAELLEPWVKAFAGRNEAAMRDMGELSGTLNPPTLVGHLALLAEGTGDTDNALERYAVISETFAPPNEDERGTPQYLSQALAFNGQRMLALREAELLRGLRRDEEAIALLERLQEAAPDDSYVEDRLRRARRGDDRRPVRDLKAAMAQALADEAASIEERQMLMGMMMARTTDTPFNHLTSSIRQSALLLDPDNAGLRLTEVGALYQHGHFAAALRLAQMGNVTPLERAELSSAAALSALQLSAPEATRALVDDALRVEDGPDAKLAAANVLVSANVTERAISLLDQALRADLSDSDRVAAILTKAQAHFQAGRVGEAVGFAREALEIDDSDGPRQFLASMLVASDDRPEGLEIMEDLLRESPNDTGLMNNLGYAMIDRPVDNNELDEGFKLLKQASRITPDEPNLLDSIGWAYYKYGDFREAERYLVLALEAYEPFNNWEIHDHMGDIHWRLGEEALARESWQASLDAFPPAHRRGAIAQKLESGMSEPAPAVRDTPEVPFNRDRGETSEI